MDKDYSCRKCGSEQTSLVDGIVCQCFECGHKFLMEPNKKSGRIVVNRNDTPFIGSVRVNTMNEQSVNAPQIFIDYDTTLNEINRNEPNINTEEISSLYRALAEQVAVHSPRNIQHEPVPVAWTPTTVTPSRRYTNEMEDLPF